LIGYYQILPDVAVLACRLSWPDEIGREEELYSLLDSFTRNSVTRNVRNPSECLAGI